VHRAGIASTQEPALRRLSGLAGGAGTFATGASTRVEARWDILLALPGGITIADISITHPLAINTLAAAATTAGAAAARRNQQKHATYSRVEPNGYPFVPFSVESYGRIGQPAMKLLHAPGDEAAGPGGVTQASFVAYICIYMYIHIYLYKIIYNYNIYIYILNAQHAIDSGSVGNKRYQVVVNNPAVMPQSTDLTGIVWAS
jgi:hypothetical protein